MTSKEALEHIIFDAKMEKPIFSMYYQEFLEPIEKDLDKLEEHRKIEKEIGNFLRHYYSRPWERGGVLSPFRRNQGQRNRSLYQ